jgi:hypothetical protein
MSERFFDRVAHLAVDGFTAGQTLDIATMLGDQLNPRRDGAPKTALLVVRGTLHLEAVDALQKLVAIAPTDAAGISALQAQVKAYMAVEDTIRRIVGAGAEIWAEMDREDREVLAEHMGLDIDDEAELSRGFDND